MGLAVSRADVRGRGRAAALTPSPSRVAHGPIPACALVIVADLSTGGFTGMPPTSACDQVTPSSSPSSGV